MDPVVELEAPPSPPTVAFPFRAAALDIGSNGIRFTAAEFSDVNHFTELEVQRFAVRLGHDTFTSGILSAANLEATVAAAVAFRQRLDDLGIQHYRAVATSAVRESRNGGELVDRIRRESGIHLETVTGSEEARLVWFAVHEKLQLDERNWLLADLGGGSIELSVINETGILWSESLPIGTVRLLEDLPSEQESPKEFMKLVAAYAARLNLPGRRDHDLEGIIITGGNAEALADLAGTAENGPVTEISRSQLGQVLRRLTGMTVRDRIERLGLREDRADVIVTAATIFDRVAELAESNRILVPRVGVKDGLLYDLAFDYASHRQHESQLDRLTRAGAIATGRRYRFDESHASHVASLAVSLFDQLQPVHALGERSRRRLETAALLHDIGQCVSYRRHHKHSYYLVNNSELPGMTPRDIRIAALVTRYHRRSEPRDYHEGYGDLNEDDRQEVRQLAGILRIADSLDQERHRRILSAEMRITGNRAQLRLSPDDDTLLERWTLKKKSSLFEKAFDLKLEVE